MTIKKSVFIIAALGLLLMNSVFANTYKCIKLVNGDIVLSDTNSNPKSSYDAFKVASFYFQCSHQRTYDNFGRCYDSWGGTCFYQGEKSKIICYRIDC